MKILIEGCSYAQEDVKNILPEERFLLTDEKVTIEHVGYFRSSKCDDFVFLLPKVLLEKVDGVDRAFVNKHDPLLANGFSPKELIDPEQTFADGRKLSDVQKSFLYEFAVWIYRAIAQYKSAHPGTTAVWQQKSNESGNVKRKYVTNTLLDVILALLRFHRENRAYFTFKIKEAHTGFNKINWVKTVAKSRAVFNEMGPIYLDPRNKKRAINFDEELLILFYSILRYVQQKFGFPVEINIGYELIKGKTFERYLDGYGVRRLKQIKYKYFSDRDLTLWQLCYAFFEKAHKITTVAGGEEYLLAKNFEIVFETIIDDLIGDKELSKLRELSDGKEIDHLYLDESLTRRSEGGRKTFYIADSKYYKRGNALASQSVAKQFTYARNLLQLDLDLFLSDENDLSDRLRDRKRQLEEVGLLRDNVTEGYDVIPNFFISATLAEDFDYNNDKLALHNGGKEFRNIHFENRLFDRDTLILSHYDVNFLYVIKLYAQNQAVLKSNWREKVRKEFKRHIRAFLGEHFKFYAMMPYDNLSDEHTKTFLDENFRSILGKLYAPYQRVNGKSVYALALEKPETLVNDGTLTPEGFERKRKRLEEENHRTRVLLERNFYIVESELGKDPTEQLQEIAKRRGIEGAPIDNVRDHVLILRDYKTGFLDAVRNSGYCPWLQSKSRNPYAVEMIVVPHTNQTTNFMVNFDSGIKVYDSVEALKNGIPEFKEVDLLEGAYYVWSIKDLV